MIHIDHLTLGYAGRQLLTDITTSFPAGQLTALIGRNGTGKSTLLRAIAGLDSLGGGHSQQTKSGRITFKTSLGTTASRRPEDLSRYLSFVSTERVRIANMTAFEVVSLGRAPYTNWYGRLSSTDKQAVASALKSVDMSDYASRSLDTMSDGECQRIMIARALAQETPVILLDEPTSFLDMPSRYQLCRLLSRLSHEEGKCIVFSTHELDIALHIAERIALITPPALLNLTAKEMEQSGLLRTFLE